MENSLLTTCTKTLLKHSTFNMEENNYIIISLGGSLIVPQSVDTAFLKNFVSHITGAVSQGKHFAIVCGGGHIAREYRDALTTLKQSPDDELDWMGIYATRFNAELVRISFGGLAEPAIFLDPTTVKPSNSKPVLVGGGWRPGHSSDGAAVALAKSLGAKTLVNLSNIDYVYTDDPRKNPDATPIEKINWADFRKLLPIGWNPGVNAPFDPIAAQMADSIDLEVIVMNGKNLENLQNYLDGKEFIGTTIK